MSESKAKIFTPRYEQLMRDFPLRPLTSNREAEQATEILDELFGHDHEDPGEEAYVFLLASLLEDYEAVHDPVPTTTSGREMLKYLMEENSMKQTDLSSLLEIGQGAASMLLSGERAITAEHARRLGARFSLDPGAFIQEAPPAKKSRSANRILMVRMKDSPEASRVVKKARAIDTAGRIHIIRNRGNYGSERASEGHQPETRAKSKSKK